MVVVKLAEGLAEAPRALGAAWTWVRERKLEGVADWVAEGGLRLQEFTVLLGVVGDEAELRKILKHQDEVEPSPYAGALGIHSLRWFVFSPDAKNPPPGALPALRSPADFATKALVLSFVFDGDVEDTLRGLLDHAGAAIEPILRHCHGYRVGCDAVKYLMERRLPTGFLFRDLGPLPDAPADLSDAYTPDATHFEIAQAQELERRFEEFYCAHQDAAPDQLHERFLEAFDEHGFRFPLEAVERRFVDEERWVRRAAEVARRLQALAAREDSGKRKRRSFHAKGHGLLRAKFEVRGGIDPEFRVGLFRKPATFEALLRPSNGTHLVGRDGAGDARGLAISVQLPAGGDFEADDFLTLPAGSELRQDFILMSHPVFFVPDIRRATVLLSILATTSRRTRLLRALAYAIGSGRFRHLGIAGRTLLRKLVHPLAAEFHSATSYGLGKGHVVKYSVELADKTRFERLRRGMSRDFLSAALKESLRTEPIELRFYLHALPSAGAIRGGRFIQDVVEDATLDWTELGAKKVQVATLTIGIQDPALGDGLAAAEAWTFNPWHALKEHRPLGSLNRARLQVYRASQIHRGAIVPEMPGVSRSGFRAVSARQRRGDLIGSENREPDAADWGIRG
jgi:hypothetical protein